MPEEGPDRGQTGVAGPNAVAALALEDIEESENDIPVEVGDGELTRRSARSLRDMPHQEPKAVSVACDGSGACVALLHQVVAEEGLQEAGERGLRAHEAPPKIRSAARPSSSAVPVM